MLGSNLLPAPHNGAKKIDKLFFGGGAVPAVDPPVFRLPKYVGTVIDLH